MGVALSSHYCYNANRTSVRLLPGGSRPPGPLPPVTSACRSFACRQSAQVTKIEVHYG